MAACTVLATKSDDVSFTAEDMSLCSVVQAGIKDRESNIVRNSTFLSNCHEINEDFVPNEISVIEGKMLCDVLCRKFVPLQLPSSGSASSSIVNLNRILSHFVPFNCEFLVNLFRRKQTSGQ